MSWDLFLAHILAGKAVVTLLSLVTGNHYTYSVRQVGKEPMWKVFHNTGRGVPAMLCIIREAKAEGSSTLVLRFMNITREYRWHQAWEYVLTRIIRGVHPPGVVWMHENICGHCGRKLTDPHSIASGIGPECAKKVVRREFLTR